MSSDAHPCAICAFAPPGGGVGANARHRLLEVVLLLVDLRRASEDDRAASDWAHAAEH